MQRWNEDEYLAERRTTLLNMDGINEIMLIMAKQERQICDKILKDFKIAQEKGNKKLDDILVTLEKEGKCKRKLKNVVDTVVAIHAELNSNIGLYQNNIRLPPKTIPPLSDESYTQFVFKDVHQYELEMKEVKEEIKALTKGLAIVKEGSFDDGNVFPNTMEDLNDAIKDLRLKIKNIDDYIVKLENTRTDLTALCLELPSTD